MDLNRLCEPLTEREPERESGTVGCRIRRFALGKTLPAAADQYHGSQKGGARRSGGAK